MNTRPLLADAVSRLRAAGIDSPQSDVRILLAHACGVELARLPLLDQVDDAQAAEFEQLITLRERRIPVQHLTGRAHFRYLDLVVGPGVFVPRPETEVMTGWAIERIRTYNFAENRIADHRIGFKAYNLDQVLNGDLAALIAALQEADTADRLAQVADAAG